MDLMILGETIRTVAGTQHLGYWMPRGGDQGTGAVEVTALSGTLTVKMQTKNADELDSAASELVSASVSTGVTRVNFSGAKELVRYVLTATGTTYAHFQFVQPQWAPN